MSPAGHVGLRAMALALAGSAVVLAVMSAETAYERRGRGSTTSAAQVRTPTSWAANLPPVFGGVPDGADGFAEGLVGSVPPQLIGVAGRLPDDVEVLVRLADGSSATLQPGEEVGGWELVSATVDRAVFARGAERQVVMMGVP